ncbi:hypothetical protein BJX99DRAFT_272126 [Aspergillus californicus]
MSKTRHRIRREITYVEAKEEEVNILHQLGYHDKQAKFFSHLYSHREAVKNIVAHHLYLCSSTVCHISNCVLVRFPLPYRVGDEFRPGNGDEKVRCEAATYAWLQENCPDIPISRLYGSAVSTGETFTRLDRLPFVHRLIYYIQSRILSWLGRPVPSTYVPHPIKFDNPIQCGYLLLEYIEPSRGSMLSNTWLDAQNNIKKRKNFFRGLSRVLLSMSRIPLPRIGSFTIDNPSYLALANRLLSAEIQLLQNEGIPTGINHEYTYSTTDSYVADILTCHDNQYRHQLNVINDVRDSIFQLSSLTAMRTISKLFLPRDSRRGPFVLSLTDLHSSNIFVDRDWNITCLIDLEWACSRPIEMIGTPHWLTDKAIDGEVASEYDQIRREFMDVLVDEERNQPPSKGDLPILSEVMTQIWDSKTFWYTLALSSLSALFTIFKEHIRPLYFSKYLEE